MYRYRYPERYGIYIRGPFLPVHVLESSESSRMHSISQSNSRRQIETPGPNLVAAGVVGSESTPRDWLAQDPATMGIGRDSRHKRRETGGKRAKFRKKRKFELARPPAMTKLAPQRIHTVRTRGGNKKYRALRLDTGNFSWGSEAVARKTRIIDVVYNAANNELVRTKTLVKNAIVVIDAAPFRQW